MSLIYLYRNNGFPIKKPFDNNDGSGDSMLWAGLIASLSNLDTDFLSGLKSGFKLSQNENGRFWRSPLRTNKDTINSFSRDMGLGVLLFFATICSEEKDMFNRWLSYIKKNNWNLFSAYESTDNRHKVTITFKIVLEFVNDLIINKKKISLINFYFKFFIYFISLILMAISNPEGYRLHLVGVNALLCDKIAEKTHYKHISIFLKIASKIVGFLLYKRCEDNLFFNYLAGICANSFSDSAKRIIDKINNIDLSKSRYTQWCWERSMISEPYSDSMGWDFLFIQKLYPSVFNFEYKLIDINDCYY